MCSWMPNKSNVFFWFTLIYLHLFTMLFGTYHFLDNAFWNPSSIPITHCNIFFLKIQIFQLEVGCFELRSFLCRFWTLNVLVQSFCFSNGILVSFLIFFSKYLRYSRPSKFSRQLLIRKDIALKFWNIFVCKEPFFF